MVKICPYINKEKRKLFEEDILNIVKLLKADRENVAGNINYMLFKIVKELDPKRYKEWNEIIGCLECAKQEIIRRKVNPYEELCISRNGDVE